MRMDQKLNWDAYPYRYPTSGSSEGLFHAISIAALTDKNIYQLDGEYQGYRAYTEANGKTIITLQPEEVAQAEPGIFCVSFPSARDGNLLDKELWNDIVNHHEVILDLAYLGMTEPIGGIIDLNHPSIRTVLASFSKPFGLYYYRIGLCWSRDPIASLYGNKWFKNAHSIKLGEHILDSIDVKAFREEGQRLQIEAIDQTNKDLELEKSLIPADVYLLATTNEQLDEKYEKFKRIGAYRFCLTPYFYNIFKEGGDYA